MCWDLDSSPLQEQQTLFLTTEFSSQSPPVVFLTITNDRSKCENPTVLIGSSTNKHLGWFHFYLVGIMCLYTWVQKSLLLVFVVLIWKQNCWIVCRDGETLEHSALSQMSLLNYSLKTQEFMQKRRQKDCQSQRWWMTPSKQYLLDTTTPNTIRTHRDYNSTHKTHASSNQTEF